MSQLVWLEGKQTLKTAHCALESKRQGRFFFLLPQVLHYGPTDNSKTGTEEVISFIYGLPDETWPESDPSDPLSVVDQMELALAYGCPESVDRESLVEYIHHNRDLNTRMIGTVGTTAERINSEVAKTMTDQERMISNNTDHIESLKEEVESDAALLREVQAIVERQNRKIEDQENKIEELYLMTRLRKSSLSYKLKKLQKQMFGVGAVKILVRKNVGNPVDFFHKTWSEYKSGFSANGESWLGLESLHTLTSQQSYMLKITMTDFDGRDYIALYNQFKVSPEDDGYRLSVTDYNAYLSNLGDSMIDNNGAMFSTRDRDQDGSDDHCAEELTGGWWYKSNSSCGHTHLTGQHTDRRIRIEIQNLVFTDYCIDCQIFYYCYLREGEGGSWDSWAEAEMVLVPN